jgi:hypothetical protein
MIAATRPHGAQRRATVEPSKHGVTLCLWSHKGLKRVELTRKQAAALAERLNRALGLTAPPRADEDEERWLDPQIM